MIGIIFIFIILISVYIGWYFTDYKESKYGCCGKIKFSQYLKFKEIAPEKWAERSDHVEYYGSRYMCDSLYFSQIDYIKYKIYVKHSEKADENYRNNERMADVIKGLQKDIDKYRKDHPITMNSGDFNEGNK